MALKLYSYPGNKNANKALIAAKYVGVTIETPAFNLGTDNKSEEYLKKNPFGKVPVLDTENGAIFESNAIARYVGRLADTGLVGSTAIEQAHVEQFIDSSTFEIDAPICSWFYPLMGWWPYDKKKETAAADALKKALGALDAHLADKTFLVGDRVTLADIVTALNLYNGYTKLFDAEFRSAFPNVERYFVTLVNQPEFKAVLGETALCKEALKYTPPKKEEKKAEKPKEKPAAAAPAPADAAADEPPKEEKKRNPLDDLPPSKMALDSWKRLYSNTPAAKFREIACKGLWAGADVPNSPTNEHFPGFDPEGFSIWFCTWKYPEENTVNFMCMNKVGGFLQRIDYARKYAFAVICILKDDKGQFPIEGFFIFRGQDIPPIMVEECYDLELYNWAKADPGSEADRKKIEDMICEEAVINGMECVDCKVFK